MSVSSTYGYKASSLGYRPTTPTRNSPFRRPESPASPSPLRNSMLFKSNPEPFIKQEVTSSPVHLAQPFAPNGARDVTRTTEPTTPRRDDVDTPTKRRIQPQMSAMMNHGKALAQLEPAQTRTLRDSFQILDRDCDGVVNRDDVADMLNQLGLPSGASEVSAFFPPSAPQTMGLAAFLNNLADTLSAMSPSAELLSAFSAFDNDDSGQIDVAELRDALLNTAPEPGQKALSASEVDRILDGFTGRRAFNRNMNAQLGAKKGNVFKYHDFVNSIAGTGGGSESTSQESSEG